MKNDTIFPAAKIAFYEDNYPGDALLGPKYKADPTTKNENIDIFDHGPWQYPAQNTRISARYIIGQSKSGFHWRTEFCFKSISTHVAHEPQSSEVGSLMDNDHWSPASKTINESIKRARRCIAIQAQNLNLDIKTQIKIRFESGREVFFNIDQIPLDPELVYRLNKDDLDRVAQFNGYLSWREFEHGILDFSIA